MVVHNIMSQIVNISLGVSDPNPGNYTVSVKDCDVTTYTDVASSLTYSDFPFQFDVESFITGTCFEYQVIDMDSGAICYASANIPTSPTPTPTITPTPTPTPPVVPDCVSGTTNGNYEFMDCCGVTQRGSSLGVVFCVNTTLPYSGIDVTSFECTPNCDEGPLSVTFSGTPDCGADGSIYLDIEGGTNPYYIVNSSPGTIPTTQGNGPFNFSGLSATTYVFNISDSTLPTARELTTQVVVNPCFEVDISGVDITCNLTTGIINISGNSLSYPYHVYLYYNGNEFSDEFYNENIITIDSDILPGEYYAIVVDGNGQTGQTDTVTINSVASFDYEVLITGASPCLVANTGYGEVTNFTGGTPPFTYFWSTLDTTPSVSNLPAGDASVTVTDANGCVITKRFTVPQLPLLGVSNIVGTQPTCFDCDGTITVTVTGGTLPYYFSGSTGQIQSGSTTFTLNSLCGGAYNILIEDAGQCSINQPVQLTSTAGFSLVSIITENSDCGEDGSIQINVNANQGPLTYTLTGSGGNIQTVTTTNQSYTFENLASGTYQIGIELINGCKYTDTATILNENKFTVATSLTATTCGQSNGEVNIEVSSGTTEIKYPLSYVVSQISDGTIVSNNIGSLSNIEFVNNLSQGSYQVVVTDNEGCAVTQYFTILEGTGGVQAILYGTPCVSGNDGTATLSITNGVGPFTVTWSSNVPNGQTGNFLTGLSGGTYTATILDSDGCSLIKSVTILCENENVDDYVINTLCEQDFVTSSEGKRGFYEMLNEAFLDLNIPGSNCYFESAEFTGVLTISGGSYGVGQTVINNFYTGTTLTDVPSDNLWETIVQGMLSQFSGITYTTDLLNNIFTVKGDCNGDVDPLNGAFIELRVEIDINVNCAGRIGPVSPTPTSTVTPTVTPTITVTPSITATPGATPTTTPTVTLTPTPSSTQPVYSCTLTVVGTSRQISCELNVEGSVNVVAYDLLSVGEIK